MDIRNASTLVTGGASGLGEATVRKLRAAGANVVILDRDAKKGEALAGSLGAGCRFVNTDVTSTEQVQAAIDAALALGPLRAAVCCAGVGWVQRTLSKEGVPHDLELFRKVLEINVVGTFNVLRLAAAAIAKNTPGPSGERGDIAVIDNFHRHAKFPSDAMENVTHFAESFFWNGTEQRGDHGPAVDDDAGAASADSVHARHFRRGGP